MILILYLLIHKKVKHKKKIDPYSEKKIKTFLSLSLAVRFNESVTFILLTKATNTILGDNDAQNTCDFIYAKYSQILLSCN